MEKTADNSDKRATKREGGALMSGRLSKVEELDIATRAAKGNQQAREQLIIAHAGLVHATAAEKCRKYNCWDKHDDLVSEGFIALIKAVDDFDPGKGTRIATFAWKRINGAMIDHLKRNGFFKRSILTDEMEVDIGENEPDPSYEQIDTRLSILKKMLEALDEKESKVIMLYYFEELSTKEVAARLNITVSAVKTVLHRARAKLREALQ